MAVAFPPVTMIRSEDTKNYKAPVLEDVTIRASLEGGYEFSRPRSTRSPRKTIGTGWGWIEQADYDTLISFWNDNGGYTEVDWTDPVTGAIHLMKFTKPFVFVFIGGKNVAGWECKVEMKEV